MTQDGEPFNQDELDEMLELAIDPHTQTVPYEYYINQLMVGEFGFRQHASFYFPPLISLNQRKKVAFIN